MVRKRKKRKSCRLILKENRGMCLQCDILEQLTLQYCRGSCWSVYALTKITATTVLTVTIGINCISICIA